MPQHFLSHQDRTEIILAEQAVAARYTFVQSSTGLVHLERDGLPTCRATTNAEAMTPCGPPTDHTKFCRPCTQQWYQGRKQQNATT